MENEEIYFVESDKAREHVFYSATHLFSCGGRLFLLKWVC